MLVFSGRVQIKDTVWKTIVVVQSIIILLLMYQISQDIVKDTPQRNDATSSESQAQWNKAVRENGGSLQDKKKQFNSASLKLIQSQTSIYLVREIQTNWLKPPSDQPYNITVEPSNDKDEDRLRKSVLNILDRKKNGFFIECGAYDGVYQSNTLHLEREYNWTGLLVEADPNSFTKLIASQRKAWSINACLSIEPHEGKIQMTRLKNSGALSIISEFADESYQKNTEAEEFEAQCFPLTSILSALGQTFNVDYFSLDVAGAELKILKTVPWDFVYIKVISLEANEKRIGPIKTFLDEKNYEFFTSFIGTRMYDHVFVHRQFITERNQH